MNDIKLVRVNTKNYDDLVGLEVNEDQKNFVADNCYSLAEAYATNADGEGAAMPFGIYDGETPVGFLMIGYNIHDDWEDDKAPDFAKNSYLIWRFMIDRKYQGKGYGKAAMKLVLDYIKTFPCGSSELCWLSYEPENEAAKKLYASFGFVERPDFYQEGEEMPAVMKL